jgi:MFS family permease
MSAGCYSYIIPIYVGEIASNKIRGRMLSFFQVFLNIGVLFVFTVGNFASLLVLNIVCASIPILYSLGFFALPESPIVLIEHNRESDAMKSLTRLRGRNFDFESEMETLKSRKEDSKLHKKSFAEVFKTKSTRKAFIIIMLQFFFFQMSGINMVLLYSTTIFIHAGIGIEAGIASIIVSLVQVVSTFFTTIFADRFGRKVLLSLSNAFMCLGLIGIGTFFVLKDDGSDVDSLGWLPVLSLCIFVIAFSAGKFS